MTDRLPASTPRLTRIARPTSRVQIEPDRPYVVCVRQSRRVGLVLERHHRDDGPKISSLHERVVLRRGQHDGGREPEAGTAGALAAERTTGASSPDVRRHAVAVRGADERSHLGRVESRVLDADALDRRLEQLEEVGRTRCAARGSASGRSSPGRRCRRRRTARSPPPCRGRRRRRSRWRSCRRARGSPASPARAQPSATRTPTSVEPVNTTFATSGCVTNRSPTTEPLPGAPGRRRRGARPRARARRCASRSAA